MTTLYAQPYDFSATGFYFESFEEYNSKSVSLMNEYGEPVEEFEIQFIDGDGIDCQIFEALNINQCTINYYFEAVETWGEAQKIKVVIAIGEVGYSFDLSSNSPEDFNVNLYECDSLRELAEQFVEDGLYGAIPESIQYYLDFEAIGRDLAMDYAQIKIDGTKYIYRCD